MLSLRCLSHSVVTLRPLTLICLRTLATSASSSAAFCSFQRQPRGKNGPLLLAALNGASLANIQCSAALSSKNSSSDSTLADNILKAKVEQQQQDQQQQSDDQENKGPKPMSKWQTYGYIAFAVLSVGGLVGNGVLFSLPEYDEQGQPVADEFSPLPWYSQYFRRLKSRFFKTKKDLEEPFRCYFCILIINIFQFSIFLITIIVSLYL